MEVTYSAGSKKELPQHTNKDISTSSGGIVENSTTTSTFFSLAPNTALDLPFPKSFTRDLGLYSCSATPSPTPSLSPTPSPSLSQEIIMIRYRECQKNHAAHLGSHVVDGCGEFMPAGNDGTPQSFRCAACDCHRNFHRREVDGETTSTPTPAAPPPSLLLNHSTAAAAAAAAATATTPAGNCFISFNKQPPRKLTPSVAGRPTNCHNNNNNSNDKSNCGGRHAAVMMAFGGGGAAAESSSEDLNGYRAVEMGGGQVMMEQYGSGSKKRYRTKFTQEQKEKMAEFAEKIEWKMQKENEELVQQLCREVGINRQVFKVWMHNNKQTLKRKELP